MPKTILASQKHPWRASVGVQQEMRESQWVTAFAASLKNHKVCCDINIEQQAVESDRPFRKTDAGHYIVKGSGRGGITSTTTSPGGGGGLYRTR